MRIEIVINDQTIMEDIDSAIGNMEAYDEITFKDDQERKEFADDCFDEIASMIECYADYFPDWDSIQRTVYNMADQR